MEHLWILDKRLGNTVSRIVGRSVVREIMVRNMVVITLLWTLATSGRRLIICLAGLLG